MIHFDTQSRFVHSSILDKPRKSLFSSHKSSTTSLCLCEPYYSLLIWFLYYSDCRNNSCTHLNPVVQRSAGKIKFVKGKWYFFTKIVLTYCGRNCSSDREKLLKFDAEGREFAKFLRSLEQLVRTVKGLNNFW